MRWFPGTRILTWVTTLALAEATSRPQPPRAVSRCPTAATRRQAGHRDVEMEMGDGVGGVLAHVEHEPVAALGDALGLRPPVGPLTTMSASTSASPGSTVAALSMWRRGTTRTCTGAWGFRSRKATAWSVRSTMSAGMSPATMRQKMQSRRRCRSPTSLVLTPRGAAAHALETPSTRGRGARGCPGRCGRTR